MAFEGVQQQGGSYGQNNFSPTVYGFGFSNSDSVIDKTNLNFSMWKTTLRITISPLVESGTEWHIDRKNSVSIFLIPQKAKMFSDILRKYKENPDKINNFGVASGKSLITIMNPKAFNKDAKGAVINIKNVNAETGTVDASYSYETKTSYNLVSGYDEKNGSFKQDYESCKNIELDMIIAQLDEYVKAMTNATAFAVTNTLYPYVDKMAVKLGVDLTNGYNSYNRNQSYFAQNNNSGHAVQTPSTVPGGLNSLIES